jgi:hypothetical protein
VSAPSIETAGRRLPSLRDLATVAAGALLFWAPAIALRARLEEGERFHLAIALFGALTPAALLAVWRAWLDSPTRAERLRGWIRLAFVGPYAGAVAVGAITYFAGSEYDAYRSNPAAPAASGLLLPIALLTVRAGQMLLEYALFAAFAVVVVATLFIPRGAHRAA